MKNTFFGLTFLLMACASQPPSQPVPAVELSPSLDHKVQVRVGQSLAAHFDSYGSVGYGASWSVADEKVIAFVKEDIAYKNTEAMARGMTGADDGIGTFTFTAKTPGKTQITIVKEFRGKVESSEVYEVTVLP